MNKQIKRIGIGASLAGMTGAHRMVNPETNANFKKWCAEQIVPAMQAVKADAALMWCLGGRADPGVDLDFDQMTSARIEGAITASYFDLCEGMNAIADAMPADGEIWYYLGMVEKSVPKDPTKQPYHAGRQWTRMRSEVRDKLVFQELELYPHPVRGRQIGFVIDSGANVAAHSASHEVAQLVEIHGYRVGAEPLASPTSWMHSMRKPTTSFVVAATLAYTEDHNFDATFGTLRPTTTGNVHTAVWFLDLEDWAKYGDRAKRWWDAGCSLYFSGDIALAHGAKIREVLADVPRPQIPPRVKGPAPKAVQ